MTDIHKNFASFGKKSAQNPNISFIEYRFLNVMRSDSFIYDYNNAYAYMTRKIDDE
jgi:CRISPR/Cas system CSM-associated protein Csm4 (group 5 of RAMP superfamily)